MAKKKITELPAATTPLDGTEKVEIVQAGINKQVNSSELGGGGSGTVESVTGDGVDNTDPDNPVLTFPVASEVANTPAGSIAATDVQTALNELDTEKAPLASPTFTGTPSAPTASPGTNTTQLATTAFVTAAAAAITKVMQFAVTDEVTNIATGNAQISFRMPYAMTLTAVRASLNVAQASGTIFTVDINEAGTTILSTKLTIDNTAKTSVGAATPYVISDASLADDSIITVDVDQIGNGSAIGLKITFIGT